MSTCSLRFPVVLSLIPALLPACSAGASSPSSWDEDGPPVVSIGSPDEGEPPATTSPATTPAKPPSSSLAAPTCDAGASLCAGLCVRVADDPAHCGFCGHSCEGGACVEGRCAPAPILTRDGPIETLDVASGTVLVSAGATRALLLPGHTTPITLPDLPQAGSYRALDGIVAFVADQTIDVYDPVEGYVSPLFTRAGTPRLSGFGLGLLDWIEPSPVSGKAERLVVGDVLFRDTTVVAEVDEPIVRSASLYYYVYFATKSGKVFRALRDTSADPDKDLVALTELPEAPESFAVTYGLVTWTFAGGRAVEGLYTRTRTPFRTPELAAAPEHLVADETAAYFVLPARAEDGGGSELYRIAPGQPTPTKLHRSAETIVALRSDERALYFGTREGTVFRWIK